MATKPLKPCGDSTCPNLSDQSYCPEHRKERNKQRGSASERGYDAIWRTRRLAFLRAHPVCEDCEKNGRVTPATEVDHIDGDNTHNEWSNYSAKCKSCHSKKTTRENGSFGRAKKSMNNEGDD